MCAFRRAQQLSTAYVVIRVGGCVRKFFDSMLRISPARSASIVAMCAVASSLLVSGSFSIPALAETRRVTLNAQSLAARSESPLIVLVSLRKQRIRIFDDKGEVTSSRISSGQPGFDTPTGVFSILEKSEHHESNIYEGAEMPFMQRITWSGIALHAGVVPGYRASHGCIRLPYSFAQSIFSLTKQGNRVIVTNDDLRPEPIEHSNLYRPLPAEIKEQASVPAAEPAPDTERKPKDTKVAVNTTGSEGTLPNFIGLSNAVTPAAAETAPAVPEPASPNAEQQIAPQTPAQTPAAVPDMPLRPRSRAEAEKLALDKIAKLKDELKTAEADKSATTDKAKTALRAAQEAGDRLSAERKSASALLNSIADAEKRLGNAKSQFEAHMRAPGGAKTSAKQQASKHGEATSPVAAEERETDFEDAILDATIELDRLRRDAADPLKSVTAAEAALKAADEAKAAVVAEVRDVQTRLRSAQTTLIEANKDLARRSRPLSVLVSLKSERIYVRQGFEPVLEAPIAVDKTAGKVGTHVFTAMKFSAKDPDKFEWHHVSAQGAALSRDDAEDDGDKKRKSKRREADVQRTTGNVQQAMAALNAFEIPDDVLDLIMERARPGASLIVSDRELHNNENGPGTEFTLLTR